MLTWKLEKNEETGVVRHVAEFGGVKFQIINWGGRMGWQLTTLANEDFNRHSYNSAALYLAKRKAEALANELK